MSNKFKDISIKTTHTTAKWMDTLKKLIKISKYLALAPTNKSKEIIKKYEELWSKIWDLIRLITKNSDDYDEKYIKIKFNSDDQLPVNKKIEILGMIIVVRAIFFENNKYYPHVFSHECFINYRRGNKNS